MFARSEEATDQRELTMTANDAFTENLAEHLRDSYDVVDRIVLNGYFRFAHMERAAFGRGGVSCTGTTIPRRGVTNLGGGSTGNASRFATGDPGPSSCPFSRPALPLCHL